MPRHRQSRSRIDRADLGMAVGAADETGVECARQRNVIDKAASPREQGWVFETSYARAEMLHTHAASI